MQNRPKTASLSPAVEVSPAGCLESNAVLAKRISAQDSSAFAQFVDRYQQFVFGICFSILRHRQDAEDATQDTFTRVARYLDRWDPRRPLEPWLATVAGNRSRSHLARRRSYAPLTAAEEPESLSTPQDQAAEAMREEIALAMGDLPDRQRMAFEFFHEHSMSYIQIAGKMNCPVGTVKTLVHRARLSLINQLQRRDVVISPSDQKHTSPTGDSQ
jgi:RNA polymerase sigma-70 factor (ECF subfamily)